MIVISIQCKIINFAESSITSMVRCHYSLTYENIATPQYRITAGSMEQLVGGTGLTLGLVLGLGLRAKLGCQPHAVCDRYCDMSENSETSIYFGLWFSRRSRTIFCLTSSIVYSVSTILCQSFQRTKVNMYSEKQEKTSI